MGCCICKDEASPLPNTTNNEASSDDRYRPARGTASPCISKLNSQGAKVDTVDNLVLETLSVIASVVER